MFSVTSECGKADLVFVFDSSLSIEIHNWRYITEFGIHVTRSLVIGPNKTRIACVIYSDRAYTEFGLDGENHVLFLKQIEMCTWKI